MEEVLRRPLGSLVRLDWEKLLYIIVIILALLTRLGGLGDRVQSHDESLHTKFSWDLYEGSGFRHTPLMHGPFLFHAAALSYFLFGDSDFSARLPVALLGVALVAFPYFLRRWLGRAGALVTSALILISPSIAYYSRYIRHDIPVIVWSLVVVFSVFSYLHDGRERWLYLLAAGISLMFATKEVAFIYNATFGVFLVGLFVARALGREWTVHSLKLLFLVALTVMMLGLFLFALGMLLRPEEQAAPGWWSIGGAFVAGLAFLAAVGFLLVGTWRSLLSYRSFDLVVVLGTLCLPFLSPLLITAIGQDPVDYNPPTLYYSAAIAGAFVLVSAGIGLVWNWRRWSVAAAIHYAILVLLFTTVFTNGTGIASGMVGSLGYWLAQQEVERGSQPWYYYMVVVPLYDYLPLLLGLVAAIYATYAGVRRAVGRSAPSSRTGGVTFIPFVLWWTALAWISYTIAGEKMPWLAVHLALPMILLSGWLVGRLIERIQWKLVLERRGWLLALVTPPFIMASSGLAQAALAGPLRGNRLVQLDVTGRFLGGLGSTLALGTGLGYLVWRAGWRVATRLLLLLLLLVPVFLTVRTAWRFCYINYDYPIEHLVYAHSGPAVKETMRQIEELSRRITGGPNSIKVAFGSDGSWPFYWYLRNYPNAVHYGSEPSREQLDAPVVIAGRDEWDEVAPYMGDDYFVNTYTYLWWPSEDYRDLTWTRVVHAITDTQTRAALWDIWYDRDYRRYDELKGKTHTLDEWPLRNEYRLYIRRDAVARMWDLSTTGPREVVVVDPYADGWQDLRARLVFGSEGAEPGQLLGPRGIAVGPDGFIYVADSGNRRIQKFSPDGGFVAAWGGFNEPWDVAIAPDGTLYVADTWNHRIERLDAEGSPVASWGTFGQYGVEDAAGQGVFYGPRGVDVDRGGVAYVADTGNKRIQVFDPNGEFVRQWGGGGVLDGYLDEPVGISIGPDNSIYVADTWNRRVQVFDDNGTFLRQWPIEGWDTGLPEEKPYLAVDAEGYVYVTDPGHYRVLVFDSRGNYEFSFGQYGTDEYSFGLPTGIAVTDDGAIYVTDAKNCRVLVFAPSDWQF